VELTVPIAGQTWLLTWTPQQVAPVGTNHGSSGVCFTDRGVVLVSRDRERWEFPAGRPEADEGLIDTLRREVREEACCEVDVAHLLGFTSSRCLAGHERGTVLVRAHWAVIATSAPWRPAHEILERKEVVQADVMTSLTIEPGLSPLYEEIWGRARKAVNPAI
jgi:8-oxo-dGTP pyrophosphatase MutT (NUDIX family)